MSVAVLYAPGTNCHEETMLALEALGIKSSIVIIDDTGKLSRSLKRFSGLILPGGFSFGDHFGAGRVLSILLRPRLVSELREFAAHGKQILGICNGFQVLVESRLLPGALVLNESGHFESRWIKIKPAQWDFWRTNHIQRKLELPVASKEGRFIWDEMVFPAFHYVDDKNSPTMSYPKNPSGSTTSIAGLTDKTGCIIGMMPHPERAALPYHRSQDGLEILKIFAE